MKIILITTCTNRKTSKDMDVLEASRLPSGDQSTVLNAWISSINGKPGILPIKNLYVSRSASEMRKLAKELKSQLYFISAGLGLVCSETIRPNYDLTILRNGENSIVNKVTVGNFNPTKWWSGINFGKPISELVSRNPDKIVICAISSAYFRMVREDLESIGNEDLNRLRLVGVKIEPESKLYQSVVPYDHRFNGPDSPMPGTLSDYPQRCASHYARTVLPKSGLNGDMNFVKTFLDTLRFPKKKKNKRASDEEILDIMKKRLKQGHISSAGMLRFLRDDLQMACEQKRFTRIYRLAMGV